MESSNKIKYLEGLRGVAALCVFFHHFFLAFYPSYYFAGDPASIHLGNLELAYYRSPLSFITNGNFMVMIFFVLSGYVLSASYFKNNKFEILVSSAIRRFLRLYIPVAFTLIVAYLLLRNSVYLNREVADISHSGWLYSIWPNDKSFHTFWICLTYLTMFTRDSRYDTTTWTMCYELYGSMMVFTLLALTHKARAKWVIFIIVSIIAYYLFSIYYIAFIIGICMNYLTAIPIEKIKFRKPLIFVLVVTGLVLGGFPSWPSYPNETFYKFFSSPILINNSETIHIVGAAFIIMAVLLSKRLQNLFSIKPFVFLGDISFSLYLIHPIIIGTISCWTFLYIYYGTNSYNWSVLATILVTVPAMLIISKVMTELVDKLGIKFSKYVYNKLFRPAASV